MSVPGTTVGTADAVRNKDNTLLSGAGEGGRPEINKYVTADVTALPGMGVSPLLSSQSSRCCTGASPAPAGDSVLNAGGLHRAEASWPGGAGPWASGLEKQRLTLPAAEVPLTAQLGHKPKRPACRFGVEITEHDAGKETVHSIEEETIPKQGHGVAQGDRFLDFEAHEKKAEVDDLQIVHGSSCTVKEEQEEVGLREEVGERFTPRHRKPTAPSVELRGPAC